MGLETVLIIILRIEQDQAGYMFIQSNKRKTLFNTFTYMIVKAYARCQSHVVEGANSISVRLVYWNIQLLPPYVERFNEADKRNMNMFDTFEFTLLFSY